MTGSANEALRSDSGTFLLDSGSVVGEEGVWGRRGGVYVFRGRRVGGSGLLKDVLCKTTTFDPESDQLFDIF